MNTESVFDGDEFTAAREGDTDVFDEEVNQAHERLLIESALIDIETLKEHFLDLQADDKKNLRGTDRLYDKIIDWLNEWGEKSATTTGLNLRGFTVAIRLKLQGEDLDHLLFSILMRGVTKFRGESSSTNTSPRRPEYEAQSSIEKEQALRKYLAKSLINMEY